MSLQNKIEELFTLGNKTQVRKKLTEIETALCNLEHILNANMEKAINAKNSTSNFIANMTKKYRDTELKQVLYWFQKF